MERDGSALELKETKIQQLCLFLEIMTRLLNIITLLAAINWGGVGG